MIYNTSSHIILYYTYKNVCNLTYYTRRGYTKAMPAFQSY